MILRYYKLLGADGKCYGSGVTDGSLPEGAVECSPDEARRPLGWVEHVHHDMSIVVTGGGQSAGLTGGLSGKPEYDMDGTYDLTGHRLAEWGLYLQYPQLAWQVDYAAYWPVVDRDGNIHLWPPYEFGLLMQFVVRYIQGMAMHRAGQIAEPPSNILDLGGQETAKNAGDVTIRQTYHAGGRH